MAEGWVRGDPRAVRLARGWPVRGTSRCAVSTWCPCVARLVFEPLLGMKKALHAGTCRALRREPRHCRAPGDRGRSIAASRLGTADRGPADRGLPGPAGVECAKNLRISLSDVGKAHTRSEGMGWATSARRPMRRPAPGSHPAGLAYSARAMACSKSRVPVKTSCL